MAVDKDHQLTSATAQAAHVDAAGSVGTHPVAHHAAAGEHQAGNLLHQGGQDGRLCTLCEHVAAHYAYGHRQMPDIGHLTGTGHYLVFQRNDAVGLRKGIESHAPQHQYGKTKLFHVESCYELNNLCYFCVRQR